MTKEWINGLPPVGEVVKVLDIYQCTVKGYDGEIIIVKHRDAEGISDYKGYKLNQIEPIKSQADIDREEAVDEMMNITANAKSGINTSIGAEEQALYDAGYRKVGEEVDNTTLYPKWMASPKDSTADLYSSWIFDNYSVYKKVK